MESFANTGGSRPRYDSNQLLMLPALPALNGPGGSSTSVARSNDDVNSDNSHQRIASPASNTTEQPVEDYYGASVSASARHASPRHTSHGTVHQMTSPARFPGENANPFHSDHDGYYA
jgi:chitin synthase